MNRFFYSLINPWDRKIKELLLNPPAGPKVEHNLSGYTIAIVNRVEQLFYQEEEHAVIIEVNIIGQWISSNSFYRWNTGKKISSDQKSLMIDRVKKYFREYHSSDMKTI